MTLDRILERTRLDLAARKAAAPATALPPRPCGEARGAFSAALARPGLSVIAELKRASPSVGLIREDFDVVALARAYADAGVAAISCLTDEPFFCGKLEYLRQAKLASGVPLLRKDFIVDEYQLVVRGDASTGEHRIEVGLYEPVSGQRLSVMSELGVLRGDRLLLVWRRLRKLS